MRSRRALLFPGQGAYLPGALMELTDDAAVRDVLKTVDLVARRNGNEPVSPLLLDAGAVPADELAGTDPPRAHLAIFATSVALYRLLTDSTDARPDVLLGHSFGEIAALTAAGALTVEDGARMVAARDAACARRRPPDGGMVSLSAGATRAGAMLTALGTWEVEVAAINAPRQTVVSGPEEELSRVEALAAVAGVRARRLRAPYPFHNRVLRPVAEEYVAGLRDITVRPPAVRVFSAIGLRYYTADDDLRQALASHLTTPVRFADAVRDLYEQGVETFVECGARSILTDLVGQNLSGVTTHAPLKQRVGAASAVAAARGGAAPAPPPPPVPPAAVPPAPPEATAPPESAGLPEATGLPAAAGLPPRDELMAVLRREYAEALDYPEDVFSDDADLDADLGVDSLKQVEMFARLRNRFGLPTPGADVRVTSFRTLPAVADGLVRLSSSRATA